MESNVFQPQMQFRVLNAHLDASQGLGLFRHFRHALGASGMFPSHFGHVNTSPMFPSCASCFLSCPAHHMIRLIYIVANT